MVKSWADEHKERIELFYLPAYSPEFNPDEYLNHDLKRYIHSGKIPHTKEDITVKTINYMLGLEVNPDKVSNFFYMSN